MRKITREACDAFVNYRPFKRNNTVVTATETQANMYLFDHKIATISLSRGLMICDGGYQTATTKERLNGLPGVRIYQLNFVWYLNDATWDGLWVRVRVGTGTIEDHNVIISF